MTKYGSAYEAARAAFKAECAAANAACWICHGTLGPIDYTSKYERGTNQPLLFNLDHAHPTSIGGDEVRRANFRPSHYLRVQRVTREQHTRIIPQLKALVSPGGWASSHEPPDHRGGRSHIRGKDFEPWRPAHAGFRGRDC